MPEQPFEEAEIRGGDRPSDYIPDDNRWANAHLTEEDYDDPEQDASDQDAP